jgi:predicted branched-subunit amino acid permease
MTIDPAAARTRRDPADVAGRRHAFAEGVRDVTPMVIGVVPFALAIGAAIGTSSVSTWAGMASAPLVLAGSAQLSTIEMLDAGAEPIVIVLSALIINARLVLYSASIAGWFRDEPLRRRLALAIPVIDQLHFTCIPRFERCDLDRSERRAHYAGAAIWLATAWTASQWLAILVGARVPEGLGLGVAAPLALAGLLAKSTVDHRSIVAAVGASSLVVIAIGLPFHSALLVAAIGGIVAGSVARTGTLREVTA